MNNNPTTKQIEEVLAGVSTPADAKFVAEWFATKEGRDYLEAAMERDAETMKADMTELYIPYEIASEKIFRQIQQRIKRKRIRRICFRVAAVLIPAFFLLGFYFQLESRIDLFGTAEYEEIIVAKGERMQMMFQDGTRVYINSDSKLKYPKKFALSSREVYLEGEAYFVVTKNKHRPFIVNLNGPAIHVLGTSFNVRDYPETKNIVVCLDEGDINLTLPSEKKYNISPGEKLVYNKENAQCTITKLEDTRQISIWKQNMIVFNDTPLREVIRVLDRWYGVSFVVKDAQTLDYLYTLTLDNTLLEKTLVDLEKIAPVKFEYNEEKMEVIVKMK